MNKKSITFCIIILLLIIVKVYLVSVLPINAGYVLRLDDALLVKQANSIIEGNWLGTYDYTTLIKGVFMPIFIVILYFLKIPFIIGQELFYMGACVLFTIVIKDKIKSKLLLLLIFAILLFNPVTCSSELCRVYRDHVYTSLILYLITFIYAIFLKREYECKKLIKYFIGLGLTFSAIYLCREETIWIIPFVVLSSIITVGFMLKQKNRIKITLYIIPFSIFIISVLVVCTINYKYYGVFKLNQYWGKSFKEAYGALTRVEPVDRRLDRIPVTRRTLQKIYEVSPKFKELEEYLEGEEGSKWTQYGDGMYINEIGGGWLHWALMDAVQSKGYYENAQKANQYYIELADEINNAIDEGKIKGLKNKRVSNTIITKKEDIPKILSKIKNTIDFEYLMLNMHVKVPRYPFKDENSIEQEQLFKKIIIGEELKQDTFADSISKTKVTILDKILKFYKSANKYLIFTSIVMYIIIVISFVIKPKEDFEEFLLLTGLLTIYLCRVITVGYTSQQMYTEAMNIYYLACIYGVQYLFGILSIIFALKKIKNKFKRYGEIYGKRINNINSSIK